MCARKLHLVVGLGEANGPEVGKKSRMPPSYAGGPRCMTENFYDGVAVLRMHASPDIITTFTCNFTCNPKWPEITESIEPGQKTVDRADITVQVYHMKLLEYLQKIRTGRMFGPVVVVIHIVEFQKRELPHARTLVWQEKHHDRVVTPTFINSFVSITGSQLTDIDADAPATTPPNTMDTTVAKPLKLNRGAAAAEIISSKTLKCVADPSFQISMHVWYVYPCSL